MGSGSEELQETSKGSIGETKLTLEELTTVLTQIEACLNSRPSTPLPEGSDGMDVLTPGHFLIERPMTSLPDHVNTCRSPPLLCRSHLCQMLTQHFWQRWPSEYLNTLQWFAKSHEESRNLQVNDVVCLSDEPVSPTKWPLARIMEVTLGLKERFTLSLYELKGEHTSDELLSLFLWYKKID